MYLAANGARSPAWRGSRSSASGRSSSALTWRVPPAGTSHLKRLSVLERPDLDTHRDCGRLPETPQEPGLGVRTTKGIMRSVFRAMSVSCG